MRAVCAGGGGVLGVNALKARSMHAELFLGCSGVGERERLGKIRSLEICNGVK